MDFLSWAQIALICFLGAISPGPSLAMVVSNTVSRGKLYGSLTGIFHAFGIGIWAMLTVVGIAAVGLSSKSVMTVSQVIGACLILYVGYRTYKTNPKTQSEKTADSGSSQTNLGKAALEGFVISLMNPKIALFFLAIFSHFVDTNSSWTEICIMGLTAGIIDGVWYTAVAIAVGNAKVIPVIEGNSSAILKISGILLTLIALYLLISSIISLF